MIRIFFIGMIGSVAVELLTYNRAYESNKRPAARYKRPSFLIPRFFVAVFAGLMASVVYEVQSAILAFQIGVTAPLLIQALERSPSAESVEATKGEH